jgi:glycerol kinase
MKIFGGNYMSYVLAIDQGTSSTRALIVNHKADIISVSQKEHRQYYPHSGYVEHNPIEIWENVNHVCNEAVSKIGGWELIKSIGITNQRETIVAWDQNTENVLYNAIVWQCRRSADIINSLKEDYSSFIINKTGLVPDAYFSGSKILWLIENSNKVKDSLLNETLRFGTIDSFLVYKMSKKHISDISNASRTMLLNINERTWDEELLDIFKVPSWSLPEVYPSSWKDLDIFWERDGFKIPITGMAGDQQSALFGQTAFDQGSVKITYGTGNFALENIGNNPLIQEKSGLLTTIAWSLNDIKNVSYAIEGSVFITGALIQWLRDELAIISQSNEIEELAELADKTNDELVIVPAFSGLGAPYWNQNARGLILGITRGTTKNHIAKAALEAIALQTYDILRAIENSSGKSFKEIKVDGGASKNNYLMQLQADLLNQTIIRPKHIETTAIGAAFLSGLGARYWENLEELKDLNPPETEFFPKREYNREKKLDFWKKAVKRSLDWV